MAIIKKLSFEEIHDRRPDIGELSSMPRTPISALIDNVRSLHNVGSIFRTSDAVRLEHLYLCGITAYPPRDEIRKTSLGAEETVPWSRHSSAAEVIIALRQKGYQIIALEHTHSSIDYRASIYRFPLCVVVGNEYNGIQDHLVEMCDDAVEIPMLGMKQSLNVSVAFGVMMYGVLGHWEEHLKKRC